MKILVTGATGYVGSAVARALYAAGHEVRALVRDGSSRAAVERSGYTVAPGDLRDAQSLATHAAAADAVIHAGHVGGADAAAVDEAATRAMVTALQGSGRAFVYTSGVWVLGATGDEPADESAPRRPLAIVAWRGPLEEWLQGATARAVRTIVVRPAVVFGDDGGIPRGLGRGELPLVGDGQQVWPLVHRDDLAALYLAALERAPAGAILHGVAAHRTAIEVWAAHATHPRPERLLFAAARARLGNFAEALALSQRVSAARTREIAGWTPRHPAPTAALPQGV